MTVLVLGGNGFIGSHVIDQLLGEGHRIKVYDRAKESFRPPHSEVEYIISDFDDKESILHALRGVSTLIHLISTTVPSTSNHDPVADITGNLIATVELLEMMRVSNVRRIIFLSSGGTVYGFSGGTPLKESHPLRPICSYGIVKVAIENYLEMERVLHGLHYTVLRVSNPYGPRQGKIGLQGLIGTLLWRIAQNKPLTIWGDGSVCRDYVHVRDVARACVAAINCTNSGIYNIGSGEGHSVNELLELVCEISGTTPTIERLPSRGFDVPHIVLDCSAAISGLRWKPEIGLRDGIGETWDWVVSLMQSDSS